MRNGTPIIAIYHDPESFFGYFIEIHGKRIENVKRFSVEMNFPPHIVSNGSENGRQSTTREHPSYTLERYFPLNSVEIESTMKEKIRARREAAGLTQGEVAARMGYQSASIVTLWESGERKPPSDKLPQLARILGCSIDDLFPKEERK